MQRMEIRHRKGDTFIADCVYKDANGVPVDLNAANIDISSTIRFQNVTFPLEILYKTAIGEFQIKAQTHNWPVGTGFWDIRYVQNDIISSAETTRVRVRA